MRIGTLTIGALVLTSAILLGTSAVEAHPARTTPPGFMGTWYVHDGQLTIGSNFTGLETGYSGATVEQDTLRFSSASGPKKLTAVITKIVYLNRTTGRPTTNPDPTESQSVGDSFQLIHVDRYLLKTIFVRSSLPSIDLKYGNPYWCGPGPHHHRRLCGA